MEYTQRSREDVRTKCEIWALNLNAEASTPTLVASLPFGSDKADELVLFH